MRSFRRGVEWLLMLIFLSVCLLAGQAHSFPETGTIRMEMAIAKVAPSSTQLLVAVPVRPNSTQGFLYAFEKSGNGWKLHAVPIKVMTGRNGYAKLGEKREGDGRVPAGLFPLEFAFGYAPAVNTRMAYRQSTENDLWVDDAKSPDYNQLVKRGKSKATSFETMKRSDILYKYGLVIGYNRNPVTPGLGSAIFAHVWREEGNATEGCIAMAEKDILALLEWLDPSKKPMILMGDPRELAALPGMAGFADAFPAIKPTINEQQVLEKTANAVDRYVEYTAPDGFVGIATAVPKQVADGMLRSGSMRKGCPVPMSDLSYLALTYWGFDKKTHVGELVVHRKLALSVVKAFAELFAVKFPIERMELIDAFDGSDDKSMAANNSSAFNCREVPGKPGVFSRHSHGVAIDINPLQNPYITIKSDKPKKHPVTAPVNAFCRKNPDDCLIYPPESALFLDRTKEHPGMLRQGDPGVKAFTDRSFFWGGRWPNDPDYQHFEFDLGKLPP